MLVLRRKAGEAIVLNGVIKIYVLAVEGERVKLGIDAPPDVVIVRQELLDDLSSENQLAGNYRQSARLAPRPPAQGASANRRDLQALLDEALSAKENSADLPLPSDEEVPRTAGRRHIIVARPKGQLSDSV
ncbi:MAG TPA: carbon storage regulator [Ktedonobacterales bacterium]|nr:carbon storage regulator [Ktedonobacterales bacterium]